MRIHSQRYRGPLRQRGRGFAGLLGSLGRTLVPVLRSSASTGTKIFPAVRKAALPVVKKSILPAVRKAALPVVKKSVKHLGRSAIVNGGYKQSLPKSNARNKSTCASSKRKKSKTSYKTQYKIAKGLISTIRKRKNSSSTATPNSKKKKQGRKTSKFPLGLLAD